MATIRNDIAFAENKQKILLALSIIVIGLLYLERERLGIKAAPDVEQKSEIDDLLKQAKSVMEDESDTITVRILKAKELYEKADLLASKTDYDKEKYSHLLFDYADFLYNYGLYRDSEAVYLRQIPLAEELYGTEHPNTASTYNNIGEVYHTQGDYPKALEYHFKALKIDEKVFGTNHPNTARDYNNIGTVYYKSKEYDKALEYLNKALEIFETKLGPNHPNTKETQKWINKVHAAMGEGRAKPSFFQRLKSFFKL